MKLLNILVPESESRSPCNGLQLACAEINLYEEGITLEGASRQHRDCVNAPNVCSILGLHGHGAVAIGTKASQRQIWRSKGREKPALLPCLLQLQRSTKSRRNRRCRLISSMNRTQSSKAQQCQHHVIKLAMLTIMAVERTNPA